MLAYFVGKPNQILPREQILQDVWEDEGIMVGRSLDVFVSRLRKLLQDDDSIKIMSVHGIGYRLETSDV
ncbi:MAG: winged helix-turn-helix domain-containing protein [Lewinellaceae bacterium]|nr:winged helix-turn-helix domain-containing protein [Lewinellaceae bacterium]